MAANFTIFATVDGLVHSEREYQKGDIIYRLSQIPQTGLPDGEAFIVGDFNDANFRIVIPDGYYEPENPEDPYDPELVPYPVPKDLPQHDLARMIVRERKRRLGLGFDYDFGDERGVHHIGTTDDDMKGWRDVDTMAFKAMARGDPGKIIYIATDTGPTWVTASEWLDILDFAEGVRQPLWTRSFELQALAPNIPQDIETNPSHWE